MWRKKKRISSGGLFDTPDFSELAVVGPTRKARSQQRENRTGLLGSSATGKASALGWGASGKR
jgi:hypothetical protein